MLLGGENGVYLLARYLLDVENMEYGGRGIEHFLSAYLPGLPACLFNMFAVCRLHLSFFNSVCSLD